LNNLKVYLISVLFTLPAEFFCSLSLYFSLRSVGIVPALSKSVLIYEVAQLFGMVSTLPGNIGVTDGSLVALIGSILNLSSSVSSAATILARSSSLWFGVVLGAVFLFWTLRYWNPT